MTGARFLNIDGLTEEALGGGFKPATDPNEKTHTLGRLARGVFEKGKETGRANGVARLLYKPTWAPVNALVVCERVPSRTEEVYSLRGLSLTDLADSTNGFRVRHDRAGSEGYPTLSVDSYWGDIQFSLRQGEDLDLIKKLVALNAKAFFVSL